MKNQYSNNRKRHSRGGCRTKLVHFIQPYKRDCTNLENKYLQTWALSGNGWAQLTMSLSFLSNHCQSSCSSDRHSLICHKLSSEPRCCLIRNQHKEQLPQWPWFSPDLCWLGAGLTDCVQTVVTGDSAGPWCVPSPQVVEGPKSS